MLEAYPTRQRKVRLAEELAQLFQKYGAIKDLSLPAKSKDENKGYAFIAFHSPDTVVKIFSDVKDIVLRAKRVR